jgi:type I restriction enzyme, S subunit
MELKPGYKQTEVGVIPEEWEVRRLDELGTWKGGMTPSMQNPSYWRNGTVPWISSGDVKSVLLTETGFSVTATAVKQGKTSVMPPRSVVVVTRSGILRKYLPVAMNVITMAINQDIKALMPNAKVDSIYLLHALTGYGDRILARCLKSGTTVESIEFPWLKAFTLPLPPTEEQTAIAAALSDVDALIASLDKLIAKKRDIKKAAMQQLLTGKQRLPGFHGEWEVKQLGDVAEITMGQSPVGTSYNRDGIGAPLINGPTEFTDKHPIKIQWTSLPTNFCKKGDVLLCVRGSSTGRINISDDDYCIGRGVAAIRAKAGSDTAFINFQIEAAIRSILALTTGSTFPNIDGKSIRAIECALPTLSEQRAIATILSDMDAAITALEAKRDKTRAIKQGMMQELLTGRIRLV